MYEPRIHLPQDVFERILVPLDLQSKLQAERVCHSWHRALLGMQVRTQTLTAYRRETVPHTCRLFSSLAQSTLTANGFRAACTAFAGLQLPSKLAFEHRSSLGLAPLHEESVPVLRLATGPCNNDN